MILKFLFLFSVLRLISFSCSASPRLSLTGSLNSKDISKLPHYAQPLFKRNKKYGNKFKDIADKVLSSVSGVSPKLEQENIGKTPRRHTLQKTGSLDLCIINLKVRNIMT